MDRLTKKGKVLALMVTVMAGTSVFTSTSAMDMVNGSIMNAVDSQEVSKEKKEVKTYKTTTIDGKSRMYHKSDPLKKAGIYKTTGKYEFVEDAIVETREIDLTEGDVDIKADGKTITFKFSEPIGMKSYKDRKYKADGNYPEFNNVTVTAKKIILHVSQKDSKKSGKDVFGIATGSGSGKTVFVKGDVEAYVDNKFYKDPDGNGDKEMTFTNGIGAVHRGKIRIEGNVSLNVEVPGQKKIASDHDGDKDNSNFLNHYFINGIFAGLNYNEGLGSEIIVTGDANITTNGTGIHAGARSIVTVLGGGNIKISKHKDMAQFSLNAEEGIINMNVALDDKGYMSGIGKKTVKIEGNIGLLCREESGTVNKKMRTAVNLALVNKDSYFVGVIHDDFREKNRDEGENVSDQLKKVRSETGTTLYLQNGAIWRNEYYGAKLPEIWRGKSHVFTGSKVKELVGGDSERTAGIILQNDEKDITIDHFKGHIKVIYEEKQIEKDKKKENVITDGAIRIKKADEKSRIVLRTNSREFVLPKTGAVNEEYDKRLNALSSKLFYEGKNQNLSAVAEVAESLTQEAYAKKISFKENGQGEINLKDEPVSPRDTAVMKGLKNATLSSALLWFNHSNDMLRRLGDIRILKTAVGLWAKYQGGNVELYDKDDKDIDIHQKYNLMEVGYDHHMGDWTVGGAFSYATSKDNYVLKHEDTIVSQTGDIKTYGLALYATHLSDDGSYLDLIAKGGRVKNKYDVMTKDYEKDHKNGDRLKDTYDTEVSSLSAECGRRLDYGHGFYIEPSLEVIVSHLVGFDQTVMSEEKVKMLIKQAPMTSTIGRLGVAVGRDLNRMHVYGKLAVAHEFNGQYKTIFHEYGKNDRETSVNLKDTWIDLQVGGSLKLGEKNYVYGNFTKNFGAKINQKWRVDAGMRFTF